MTAATGPNKLHRLPEALQAADEMIVTYPDSGPAYDLHAQILEEMARRDDAIADYRPAEVLEPTLYLSGDPLRRLGVQDK
jgi:hypothetical protein